MFSLFSLTKGRRESENEVRLGCSGTSRLISVIRCGGSAYRSRSTGADAWGS